jgi:prevent-host-death family protein
MREITMSVTEFKAKCLRVLDDVAKKGDRILITNRGRLVAQVLPPPASERRTLRGTWKESVKVLGDIVNFHDEPWEVDSD